MNVLKVHVINEFPFSLGRDPEVEGAPRDESGFVRQRWKVDVGFGMKLGHG
jgi:hypothetical protein